MTTVVLTRPEAHSQRLALALSRQGFESLVMPLMTVQPIAVSERSPVPDLTEGAVCIFISANAVQYGLPHMPVLLVAARNRGVDCRRAADPSQRCKQPVLQRLPPTKPTQKDYWLCQHCRQARWNRP